MRNSPGLVCSPIEVSNLDCGLAEVKMMSWSISFFMFEMKLREKRLYNSELALAEQVQFLILMLYVSSPRSTRVS